MLNDLVARGAALVGWEKEPPDFEGQCRALIGGHGEATSVARALALLDSYEAFDDEEKRDALLCLSKLLRDAESLASALRDVDLDDPKSIRRLHFASEPPSQQLLRSLNRIPNGTQRLVQMRTDLLQFKKTDPDLRSLDQDFHHLFSSWFNRGFLQMRRIDWRTPAETLEKIIKYEAVHEIAGWDDLRHRVSSKDRRLYAFFHPALADDPLIFVEVALADGLPSTISEIINSGVDTASANKPNTAVFYSISNCHMGLAGVSFGNLLIKQVVKELSVEVPSIQTFVTLSPVSGLRGWVVSADSNAKDILSASQFAITKSLNSDAATTDADNAAVAGIAAQYLLHAKKPDGLPIDPVARFHLGNGARLERILPRADQSDRGIGTSWGTMVNYLYELADIERNHEAFSVEGKVIATRQVRALAQKQD